MTDKTEAFTSEALNDQDLAAVNGGISGSDILQTALRVIAAVVPAAMQAVEAEVFEPGAQQGIISASPLSSQGINSALISQSS